MNAWKREKEEEEENTLAKLLENYMSEWIQVGKAWAKSKSETHHAQPSHFTDPTLTQL